MIPNPCVETKEDFERLLKSCCDTIMRNKDKLYDLYCDKTTDLTLCFSFRPDYILTMDISCNKIVYENIYDENIRVEEKTENEN